MLALRQIWEGSVFTWQPSPLSATTLQKWSSHKARDFAQDGSFNGLQFEFWVTTFFLSWSKTYMTKCTNHSSPRWDCQRGKKREYLCAFPNRGPNCFYTECVMCKLARDRCVTLLFQVEYCSILYSDPLQGQTLTVFLAGGSEEILLQERGL